MFGRRWRTKDELVYLTKYQLRDSIPWMIAGLWTGLVMVMSIYVKQTWEHDFPNWFATILGIYFGVIVAMIAYFRAKRSQDIIESRIRRIEGIVAADFPYLSDGIENSKFHVLFALDGIIDSYEKLEKEARKWKRTKDTAERKYFKDRFYYIWENAIMKYGSILENPMIVSDMIFEPKVINEFKTISNGCKIKPVLIEKTNKITDYNFHITVVKCIILIDKLKIDSKFRNVLLKY